MSCQRVAVNSGYRAVSVDNAFAHCFYTAFVITLFGKKHLAVAQSKFGTVGIEKQHGGAIKAGSVVGRHLDSAQIARHSGLAVAVYQRHRAKFHMQLAALRKPLDSVVIHV